MEREYYCRFLLLDFGHPMDNSTIKKIINSLESILALGLAFPRCTKAINFGMSVLNSDFAIFQVESYLKTNYDLLIKNLNALLKTTNRRVTVHEYKNFLNHSIQAVLREFHEGFKKTKNFPFKINPLIEIFVVTKKTASVLADIVTNVKENLEKNISDRVAVKNFKIVQILSEEQEKIPTSNKNKSIDCIFCSDNAHDLECFFKDFLLNPQQHLRILLSRDLDLEIKCDVDDCLINLSSFDFDGNFDLFDNIPSASPNTSLGILKEICNLEIINRLPVKGLCPTLVFGTPRRIHATRSIELSRTESQKNSKLFKELCRELSRKGQGLLAKAVSPAKNSEFITFHFLTSDGDLLLMNEVAPDELYLPKRTESSESVDCSLDECAASIIKNFFQNTQLLNEYNPENFSSGVYDFLRNYLEQVRQSKSLSGRFDPNAKQFGNKCVKRENPKTSPDAKDCGYLNDNFSNAHENQKKKLKPGSEKKLENTHPALLSPSIVGKYRKIHSKAFNLPELGEDYNHNLM